MKVSLSEVGFMFVQRLLAVAAMLGLVWLLAGGCGNGDTSPSSIVPPDDAMVVVGTATCELAEEDGGLVAVCEHKTSDRRVTGIETSSSFTFVDAPGSAGNAWAAKDVVLTNADGTWRGSAQAAEDSARAVPYGEAHFVGEGAYEGLEYHYYWGGVVEIELRGWITTPG